MKIFGVLFIAIITIQSAIAFETYRDEIIRHVVDPCYLDIIDMQNLDGDKESWLNMLKIMQENNVDHMVSSVHGLVENVDSFEQRKDLYSTFYRICSESALSASNQN